MADGTRDAPALRVHRSLRVPLDEVEVRVTTSGGPGGQHANRNRTRVEVSLDVTSSSALGPRQRQRLLERIGPVVRASASDTRSQARNRELALDRLAAKLTEALRVERPRVATRPTAASRARRLEAKRRQSERKSARRAPNGAD